MQKIPTLFRRNPEDMRHVLPEVSPGCEWVLAGEGKPTRKYDGTCVMFDGEQWWARREVKPGKATPPGFRALGTDDATGKTVGWEPAEQSAFWKYLQEAITEWDDDPDERDENGNLLPWQPGTFELVGPKVNGNPEREPRHHLYRHLLAAPLDLGDPADWTAEHLGKRLVALRQETGAEGVVWHHPNGRMAKLKARDFAWTDKQVPNEGREQ